MNLNYLKKRLNIEIFWLDEKNTNILKS